MTEEHRRLAARVGDWLELHQGHGLPIRRGQIVEVLGRPLHEHYQVRWNEHHESMVFPREGVVIVPAVER